MSDTNLPDGFRRKSVGEEIFGCDMVLLRGIGPWRRFEDDPDLQPYIGTHVKPWHYVITTPACVLQAELQEDML
jgi:hypothetical protein